MTADSVKLTRLNTALESFYWILLVLDNFSSHKSAETLQAAANLDIQLVFLPVVSLHLQLIEPIWNTLKRDLSSILTESVDDFHALVKAKFFELSHHHNFTADWFETSLIQ